MYPTGPLLPKPDVRSRDLLDGASESGKTSRGGRGLFGSVRYPYAAANGESAGMWGELMGTIGRRTSRCT